MSHEQNDEISSSSNENEQLNSFMDSLIFVMRDNELRFTSDDSDEDQESNSNNANVYNNENVLNADDVDIDVQNEINRENENNTDEFDGGDDEDGIESVQDDDDDDDDDYNDTRQANADEYETVERPNQINFNRALPATHNYLGQDFRDISGPKVVHEQEDFLTVPILQLPGHAQILPGQVMPISIQTQGQIDLVRNLIGNINADPIIGFLLCNETEMPNDRIGILAEILSSKDEDNDPSSLLYGLMLKVRGRNRFKLISLTRNITVGFTIAEVRILPEYVLDKNPLKTNAHFSTHYLFDKYFHCEFAQKPITARIESLNNTNNPAWLYRQYDCTFLMNLIMHELTFAAFDKIEQSRIPDLNDPILFSNWLLNNFPFDDKLRLNILKLDCINQRLRYIHSVLKHYSKINCIVCRTEICKKSDIFSMSTQGFMNPYVNQNGHIHETLTVYKAKHLTLIGYPSTQFSWFQGYAWTIAMCQHCKSHIGWRFTADDKNSDLKPDCFWGLTRKSVCHTADNTFDKDNHVSGSRTSIISSTSSSSVTNGLFQTENDESNWIPMI